MLNDLFLSLNIIVKQLACLQFHPKYTKKLPDKRKSEGSAGSASKSSHSSASGIPHAPAERPQSCPVTEGDKVIIKRPRGGRKFTPSTKFSTPMINSSPVNDIRGVNTHKASNSSIPRGNSLNHVLTLLNSNAECNFSEDFRPGSSEELSSKEEGMLFDLFSDEMNIV